MKKIIFYFFLLFTASESFAFTQAEIDNCKTRVTRAYVSQCKYSEWDTDHFVIHYDGSCQPGKNEALARCDQGKMWLYEATGDTGGTSDYKWNSLIRDTAISGGVNGSHYLDVMELSIHATAGMPTLRHCYQPTFAASKLETDYITTAANCAPDPNTNFQYQFNSNSATWIYYFQPHITGFSYPDTEQTVPIYSCKGTHIYGFPGASRTYYFLSFQSNCNGKTSLNHVMGYGLNLNP